MRLTAHISIKGCMFVIPSATVSQKMLVTNRTSNARHLQKNSSFYERLQDVCLSFLLLLLNTKY